MEGPELPETPLSVIHPPFTGRGMVHPARRSDSQSDPMQASCQNGRHSRHISDHPWPMGKPSPSRFGPGNRLAQFQSAGARLMGSLPEARAARSTTFLEAERPLSSADLTTPFPPLGLLNYGYGAAPTHFDRAATLIPPSHLSSHHPD